MKLKHLLLITMSIFVSTFMKAQTVADVIINSADHNTLEAALDAADLVTTLQSEGPFTVFAPTDAAFDALPDGTVDALLNDIPTLTSILTYHVVGATALSTDLSDQQVITTLNGKDVTVTINADGVFINDAQVTVVDIPADNGVVHVIDAVLIPPTVTVVDIIVNSPDHNTLEAAVIAADLAGTLSGEGPFTVFAPTDAAFDALPDGTVDALLNDIPTLTSILTYHVVGATALSTDLSDQQVITTLNGKDVTVTINTDGVFINDAQVTVADITTDNGVVHVIDAVLLPSTTIADIVINSDVHNTLEAALEAANLLDVLDGDGPFTLFAPTDNAFANLPAGTVEALLDDIPTLTSMLTYHVVGEELLTTDLTDGRNIITLSNGKVLSISINGPAIIINNVTQLIVNDILTDNGVVHVIDAVLLPPTTVADIVIASEDHTTLEAALTAAGLVETLNGVGPFTVFAPTDDAFSNLPAGTLETLLQDPSGDLTDILLNHVVGANALSTDLSDDQKIVTLNNGKTVEVSISNGAVFINNAQVTVADITTDNGIVHVIDAVLLPPTTVADIIIESEDHTTLEAALDAAGLVETLNGAGPFTVFAPTDAAFEALPDGTVDALLNDIPALTAILTYHVVGATALSTDLADGQVITTLNGKDITVTINTDGIFINDAQVTVADITTDNGVVHVIDAVLIPPTVTVVDVIVNSPDHNTLEAAVIVADLAGTLSGEGPFTVFAPTDAAFDALPDGTIDALLNDIPALTAILTYHVVGATALSTDLADGQMITTLNGKDVTVTINNDGVFINDAQVTVADITTDNGVVHVIDVVLIPPTVTVVDVIVNSPDHNTLEAAVIAADLAGTLSGEGPFTVFAPTDAAFGALPDGTVDALLNDIPALTAILTYHVVGATALSTDLADGQMIATLNGKDITVTINTDGVFINDAQVTVADITTDNGIVHVIDAVLIPMDPNSTDNILDDLKVNISPNPTSDFLNISIEEINDYSLELFNSNGQLILQQKMNTNNMSISMKEFNQGMYFLKIITNEGFVTKRIIKQ